jgi:hypothetical protein
MPGFEKVWSGVIGATMRSQLLGSGGILEPANDHVGGIPNQQVYLRTLVPGEPPENVLSGILISGRPPDSQFESPEVLGTKMLLERTNPVVAPAPPRLLETEPAKCQIDVIVENQEVLGVDLVVGPERADRSAGVVHERVRGSQDQVSSGDAGDLGAYPQGTPLELDAQAPG